MKKIIRIIMTTLTFTIGLPFVLAMIIIDWSESDLSLWESFKKIIK